MLRRYLAFVAGICISGIAAAQSAPITIEPRDCKFFSALTAGSNRNSTDAAAFGKPFDLGRFGRASFQVSWAGLTGTADGTVKLQVASTPFPTADDWVDKSGATFTISGNDGTNYIPVTNLTERWGRIVYTKNQISGGTITGYCHAKSF